MAKKRFRFRSPDACRKQNLLLDRRTQTEMCLYALSPRDPLMPVGKADGVSPSCSTGTTTGSEHRVHIFFRTRHHDAPLALLNHMATPMRCSHIASLPCGATPHICKANRQTLRSHPRFALMTVIKPPCFNLTKKQKENSIWNNFHVAHRREARTRSVACGELCSRCTIQDADTVGYSTLSA